MCALRQRPPPVRRSCACARPSAQRSGGGGGAGGCGTGGGVWCVSARLCALACLTRCCAGGRQHLALLAAVGFLGLRLAPAAPEEQRRQRCAASSDDTGGRAACRWLEPLENLQTLKTGKTRKPCRRSLHRTSLVQRPKSCRGSTIDEAAWRNPGYPCATTILHPRTT